jgi:hypothetical protein
MIAVPIHTAASLQQVHRRQSRRAEAKQKILNAMRAGVALHRQHTGGRIRWALSDGTAVSHEAAFDVRSDPHVMGVGDCLFGTELSQTYRHVSEDIHG